MALLRNLFIGLGVEFLLNAIAGGLDWSEVGLWLPFGTFLSKLSSLIKPHSLRKNGLVVRYAETRETTTKTGIKTSRLLADNPLNSTVTFRSNVKKARWP